MASFLTSMASSGALRNAKMSDTDVTIARAKSGSLRLKLEETEAAYEFDAKQELQMAKLAKSRIAVLDAAAEKVVDRAIVTRGNVADLVDQLAMEADVEREEVHRRCNKADAAREVLARQAIVRERQGDRLRNKSMHTKVIVMRARKQLYVDDSADKMQGIERKQGRAATLARSRTEERLKVLKAQTEGRERRLVDGQAVRDTLAQGRLQFRERTRQRLNERSAHVDATRADMAEAQAQRDFAASEARDSTARFGKSLSEGKLQMSASWQQLKAERHEELMREKHNLRVQALVNAREKKRQMLNAYHARMEEEAGQKAEKYHHAMQVTLTLTPTLTLTLTLALNPTPNPNPNLSLTPTPILNLPLTPAPAPTPNAMQLAKEKQDAFETARQEAERLRTQRMQKGQLTLAAINDVAIKHTQAHRSVDEKRTLLAQLRLS